MYVRFENEKKINRLKYSLQVDLYFRNMITDGSWQKTNATNFITCDEYDGKNVPKRVGLDLETAFKKVKIQ